MSMAFLSTIHRHSLSSSRLVQLSACRWLATEASSPFASTIGTSGNTSTVLTTTVSQDTQSGSSEINTYYRITLKRSAISLGERKKATLASLGIRRRMQTVYHRHNPETAGKILAVKELVEVSNVPESAVRTQEEQRKERKAERGFVVVKSVLPRVSE
jgi:large subunit ribosomal protein L30